MWCHILPLNVLSLNIWIPCILSCAEFSPAITKLFTTHVSHAAVIWGVFCGLITWSWWCGRNDPYCLSKSVRQHLQIIITAAREKERERKRDTDSWAKEVMSLMVSQTFTVNDADLFDARSVLTIIYLLCNCLSTISSSCDHCGKDLAREPHNKFESNSSHAVRTN